MATIRGILTGLTAMALAIAIAMTMARIAPCAAADSASGPAMGPLTTIQAPAASSPIKHHHSAGGNNSAKQKAQPAADSNSSSNMPGSPFTSGHGPIKITSDSLSLDYKNNAVVFTGHVHAVQSGSELTTDLLHVNYEKDFKEMKNMIADGNVRVMQGGRWATSDHAVMDQKAQTVVMTGNPVAHDGQDQITGTKITTYLQTGKSVVDGANAIIYPKQSNSPDNATAEDPASGPNDTPPAEDAASDSK
jgi:lipopolysaccharide transport protein LptA